MGNSQSASSTDPHFVSATRSFSQKELEDLKTLFTSLAAQSNSNSKFISPSVFQTYFRVHGPLGDRLFDLVTRKRKDQKLTFEDLVIAKGIYEKGTRDEIEEFIYQLLDVTGDGILTRTDVEAVLNAILDAIFCPKDAESGMSSPKGSIDVFLNAGTFSKKLEGFAENSMTFEDYKSWCSFLPSVRKFLGSLLMPPYTGRPCFQVPHLLSGNIDSNILLLRREYAWHIAGTLSQHQLEEWKLLYHSSVNGLSFNTFLGSISAGEGSTVLIIKDKTGYIYGGYASQPWDKHSGFYGDMKSLLFQLYPMASIFRPTGANSNLQWCAVNFTSGSIPNGLGFGGQVNHFGLFLSASFDQGHTFTSSTFGNPCLSKATQINPEVIECWGVVSKVHQQEKSDTIKGSVLDRFKEDRHMLNMVGLANSSE
ncbi:hypothetical protein IFM89_004134 [Coptis chinensis]|uniref:TLD domain-containing protein 1 n=1 Tax=Coptis chinensis TaxID=261450 RepID=A0A835H1D7_9MAGN|nr:hypothetical protein IFM89_004134 [Coptis chinensis]